MGLKGLILVFHISFVYALSSDYIGTTLGISFSWKANEPSLD